LRRVAMLGPAWFETTGCAGLLTMRAWLFVDGPASDARQFQRVKIFCGRERLEATQREPARDMHSVQSFSGFQKFVHRTNPLVV